VKLKTGFKATLEESKTARFEQMMSLALTEGLGRYILMTHFSLLLVLFFSHSNLFILSHSPQTHTSHPMKVKIPI
jgi:hypothetical protein